MKNIKDQVYAALCGVFDADNVTDQYPKTWANMPTIQYTEEENRVAEHTDEGETKSVVRYRIDIWDNRSTSESALKVECAIGKPLAGEWMEEITPLGLCRTACQDVPDPSGLKHKMMRYEAIIDMESDHIYWMN